jgi:hypothetical protein
LGIQSLKLSPEQDQPALGPAEGPARLAWSHHVTHAWTWHIIAFESLARTRARRASFGPVSLGPLDFTLHLLHHTSPRLVPRASVPEELRWRALPSLGPSVALVGPRRRR